MKHEMMGWGGSGIGWTICKLFAPHSRQIITPTPHHSIFYRLDAFPDARPKQQCQSTEGIKIIFKDYFKLKIKM